MRIAGRNTWRCCASGLRDVARNCAAIASAARRRIPCACWIARFPKISPSSTRCPRSGSPVRSPAARTSCGARASGRRGIPYEVKPRMVRGLDYYMRTTFEITHGALGAQNSVLGGGRYDGLAEALGSTGAGAGNRLFDRRRSPGDERRTGASRTPQARSRRVHRAHGRRPPRALRATGARIAQRRCSVELGLDGKLKRRSNWPIKWARASPDRGRQRDRRRDILS
jgi:hypothetical protein